MRPEALELLVWISRERRSYAQAIEVWRTNCPQHSVWEDAIGEELIEVSRNGSQASVTLTARGRAALGAART
jgi:hypothetical protein